MERLYRLAPDLALLPELRRPVYKSLLSHAQFGLHTYGRPRLFSWGVLSSDVAVPRAPDRRIGFAVLGKDRTVLLGVERLGPDMFRDEEQVAVLRNVAFVVRAAVAGGLKLTAGSFAASRDGACVRYEHVGRRARTRRSVTRYLYEEALGGGE